MPDFDLRMINSGRKVIFALSLGVIDIVRCVAVHRIVSKTRYAPARALAVLLYACAIDWTRLDVAGWYSYDFTTGDVYAVSPCRNMQGKTFPGLVLYGRMDSAKLEKKDRMESPTEKERGKTGVAVAEERHMWDRAAKAQKKTANVRLDENVPAA